MNRLALSIILLAFCTSITASQTPTPTPAAADSDVVKITTNLVQIDVTVTDQKGKPVRDLKPEEIEIYENGKRQEISNFSFVSSVREGAEKPGKKERGSKDAVPVPPTAVRPEQIRRAIALVVDDLSLSFESIYQVRRALKKYVDEQMQDGDLVAIIRTSAGIGALQQFTSNKAQLYAAIEKVKWFPMGSGTISAFAPIEPTPNEIRAATGDETVTDEDIQSEKNSLQSFEDFRNAGFVFGTLGALRFIVTGMAELPGRKSVILFSDGFRLFPRDQDGSIGDTRLFDYTRQLVDYANRASVVFYTIDARGLVVTSLTAADQVISPSPEAISQAISSRSATLFDTQEGLQYLAKETGGIAAINNNDLSGGVGRAIDDQSYYLVGYVPDDDSFSAENLKFNKLEVRVKRPGVNVRYRRGFINVADRSIPKTPSASTPIQAVKYALTSPFAANDIPLRLNALFGYEPKIGTYVRSLLHIKASDLTFTDDTDGTKKVSFVLVAVSYGDNGVPVDQIGKSYTLNLSRATYEKIQKEGFVYHFTFPIKKPGPYQFRVAIQDGVNSKIGSASQFIDVPNLKKNKLTISGIVLENFSADQWRNFTAPVQTPTNDGTDPMIDTSQRIFRRGSILRYGFEVYNAKLDAAKRPQLTFRIRIFRERRLVLDGTETPADLGGQNDFTRVRGSGAVSLAPKMEPGDYVMQVIAYDGLVKPKNRIATQYVQFEVTE